MLAWKLFRLMKDGSIAPLFIDKRLRLERGVWYQAELHVTKGFSPRKGFHVTAKPVAPHLNSRREKRVWLQVEIDDYEELNRPEVQGGLWYIAQRMRLVDVRLGPVDTNKVVI